MKFYDLNIRGQSFNNDLSLVKEASHLGWDYLNLNYSQDNFKEALKYNSELIDEASDFQVNMGINILKANSNDLRKILRKFRDKTSYISCLGGDLKLNRACCETFQLDVLSRPYYRRRDSGMNHVLAKESLKNNVAIELCFRDILKNHHRYRANIIAGFKEILMFHRKFRFPLILTTGSKSIYDIRSARDIVAFFKAIGFTNGEIYNGFSYYPQQILKFNEERRNMIIHGVKVIEGAKDFTAVYKRQDKDAPNFDEEFECADLSEEFESSDLADEFESADLADEQENVDWIKKLN